MKVCPICKEAFDGKVTKLTCSTACRMAKMRGRGPKLGYVKVRKGESKWKENCVPTAISHATGMAFMHVEALLLAQGKKTKEGYSPSVYGPVLESLGFTRLSHLEGRLLDELPLVPGCWYLVGVRRHMVAVIDGKYMDVGPQLNKYRKRILDVWSKDWRAITAAEPTEAG